MRGQLFIILFNTMNKQKQAFTLVELIVVITILAILWTISFISLQWYSKNARDSIRISDTSNMKISLELFHLNSGKYPLPDDYGTFTYLWSDLFYQWYFWNNVIQSISRNMTEVPTDPLTDKKYIYSVANNKNELEILSLLEWDSLTLNTINQTNAALTVVTPRITWNYNRLFIKTSTHIVPIPSIITSEELTFGSSNVLTQSRLESMVTDLWVNIPSNWSVVSNTWALAWLILTWAIVPAADADDATKAAVIEVIKSTYVWETSLNSGWIVNYILNIWTDEAILAAAFDTTVLKNTTITNDSWWGGWWAIIDWRGQDSNCDIADITIWTQTWAGCNSTLWTWFEYWQTDADIWSNNYNWTSWSCYNYDEVNNSTDPDCAIWNANMASNVSAKIFFDLKQPDGENNFLDAEVDNIWWKLYTWSSLDTDNDNDIDWDDTNLVCWVWYHVPSKTERDMLEITINWWIDCRNSIQGQACEWLWWKLHSTTNSSTSIAEKLKIPLAGRRSTNGTAFDTRWVQGYLWTSTDAGGNVSYHTLDSTSNSKSYLGATSSHSNGFSIRCIQD